MGHNHRLSVMAFGLALGIMWGVGMLVLGFAAHWFMWGTPLVTTMGSAYVGFEPTLWGSVIGGVWGFCDGFIGGVVLAWLYNKFACKNCDKHNEHHEHHER